MNTKIEILDKLQKFLKEKASPTCPQYRKSPKDFTRERKLTFINVVLFQICCYKKTLSVSLDLFSNYIESCKKVSKSAFSRARYKLKWTFFVNWSCLLVSLSDSHSVKKWKGFRIFGIDGSLLSLPNTKDIIREFGTHGNQYARMAMARMMVAYDVLNGFCHKATIRPSKQSEHQVAYEWSESFGVGDLCIYDRCYPSFSLMYLLLEQGANFVMRCKTGFSTEVINFLSSKKMTKKVRFTINSHTKNSVKAQLKKKLQNELEQEFKDTVARYKLNEKKAKKLRKELEEKLKQQYSKLSKEAFFALPNDASITLRLVRVILDTGETEVLITSLLDTKKYPTKIFKELYFLRWKTEVFYDRLKNKAQLELFTGHKAEAILQDFHATIFTLNLQNLIINDCQPQVKEKTKNRRYQYQVNYNVSFGLLQSRIISLLTIQEKIKEIWQETKEAFVRSLVPIIPNRQFPRKTQKKRKNGGKNHTFTNYRPAI